MLVKEILQKLDLGSSVAEFDQSLEKYFVETQTFRMVMQSKADIVAGDKGTGKTALYKIVQARTTSAVIIPAFNPSGSPIFQRLAEGDPLDESTYAAIWKTYIFALVGNWMLDQKLPKSDDLKMIERVLTVAELRSLDHTPMTVFSRILDWTKKKASGTKAIKILVASLEFATDHNETNKLLYDDALEILNRVLKAHDRTIWVALDRLDEAFQGAPATEIPALRALFRMYLDLMPFDRVRVKLFVRRDLFRKVTLAGFVNLTHVNARKIEISWDEEDLKHLLCQRIRENDGFLVDLELSKESTNDVIFDRIFPAQVDQGERKSTTWAWMMSRVRDGNGIKPPRNLIDLVKKAQEAQIRREERELNAYEPGMPILPPDALKSGLEALSGERVNDTLLAETGPYAAWIEKFRDGKSEHNETSLATTLGVSELEARKRARVLMELGFLEQVGESYKVPMLYRDGLGISQGKAF